MHMFVMCSLAQHMVALLLLQCAAAHVADLLGCSCNMRCCSRSSTGPGSAAMGWDDWCRLVLELLHAALSWAVELPAVLALILAL